MLNKSLQVILLIVILANFCYVFSQDNKIATLKFELTNFKKPSEWALYYGLLQFSSNNKYLVLSGENRGIDIYDIGDGKLKSKLKKSNPKERFHAFSFSPDSKTALLQTEGNGDLELFDLESGDLVREIKPSQKTFSGSAAFPNVEAGNQMVKVPISLDWKNIVIGLNTSQYELIDFTDGKLKFTLNHEEKPNVTKEKFKILGLLLLGQTAWLPARNTVFSNDGNFLVISNGNESPTVWDTQTGKLIVKLEPQTDRVYFSIFTPDSQNIITYSKDGIFKIWETKTGSLLSSFQMKEKHLLPVAISPDYQKIVTAKVFPEKKDVFIWEIKSGKLAATLLKADSNQLTYSPDGKIIASIPSKQKQLAQLWNAETGSLIASLPRIKEENTLALSWTPDSQLLITSSKDNVKIWNSKGELLQTIENARYPISLSEDGKLLATGGDKNSGFVWEIKQN